MAGVREKGGEPVLVTAHRPHGEAEAPGERLGVEGSKALHLSYGKRDNRHTSVHGATVHAGPVRDELLARHLVREGKVRVG